MKHILALSPEDYAMFKASPHTRLYDHRYDVHTGEITIWARNRAALCQDLEKTIDFGATCASDVVTTSK